MTDTSPSTGAIFKDNGWWLRTLVATCILVAIPALFPPLGVEFPRWAIIASGVGAAVGFTITGFVLMLTDTLAATIVLHLLYALVVLLVVLMLDDIWPLFVVAVVLIAVEFGHIRVRQRSRR